MGNVVDVNRTTRRAQAKAVADQIKRIPTPNERIARLEQQQAGLGQAVNMLSRALVVGGILKVEDRIENDQRVRYLVPIVKPQSAARRFWAWINSPMWGKAA